MKYSLFFVITFISMAVMGQVNEVDSKGRKQGKWEKTYPNSIVFQYRGEFKDDKPVGKFTYFYPSSKVKAIINHNVGETGRSEAFFYHENGNVMSYGIYRELKKDSIWINYAPSGRLSTTETYKNDQLDGETKVYFLPEVLEDKSQVVASIKNFKEGVLDGEYKEFFLNKRVKLKGVYVNNKRDGAWEEFHVNGKRAATYRYSNGKKHGYQIGYDETGNRLAEIFYYYGRRLEGKQLEDMVKEMEDKGVNPYTMTTN